MKVFVVHYAPHVKRKADLLERLKKANLEAEFILEGSKDIEFASKVSPPIKDITSKHVHCYQEIAAKYNYALILENDAIFCNNFRQKFDSYFTQIPSDWDMCFIGDGAGLHIQEERLKDSKTNIYLKDVSPKEGEGAGGTRCLDSYLVSNRCANKILSQILQVDYKIEIGADSWLNNVIRDNKLIIYWAEPTIITQGSENGTYESSWKNKD